MNCPRDTNDDGNCGQRLCPYCGDPEIRRRLAELTAPDMPPRNAPWYWDGTPYSDWRRIWKCCGTPYLSDTHACPVFDAPDSSVD